MNVQSRKAAQTGSTDAIEDVATRLFIQHGYNGVSYLDIARELGITHASIHYYFRTKDMLAESVLRRVAESTRHAMSGVWTDPATTLFEKFVGTRDWIHSQYLLSNPGGKGGKPWGLLWRFAMDSDALNLSMKRLLRSSFDRLEADIARGVHTAVESGELAAGAPEIGITLQIGCLMSSTGQLTRQSASFDRLNEAFRWTHAGIARAYGRPDSRQQPWPAVPRVRAAA